jgi:hypothetical protein
MQIVTSYKKAVKESSPKRPFFSDPHSSVSAALKQALQESDG